MLVDFLGRREQTSQEKNRLLEAHRVHAGQSGRVCSHLPIHHLMDAVPGPPELAFLSFLCAGENGPVR
jgi:hypothetical protein